MSQIKLSYLYRDWGNNKNHGTVVFANPSAKELDQITSAIKTELIDGEWFYCKKWGLPDLHFEKWDSDIDHNFHEFKSFSFTNETPSDNRTIDEFISEIKAISKK